eukprot:5218390-Ditylum_brightwellii.AAC.1
MEEWLKFCQNLQAVITVQNITDSQGSEQTPIQTGIQENYGRRAYTHVPAMSLCYANQMNDQMEQFLPREDGTPHVKLAEDKLMDILENAATL